MTLFNSLGADNAITSLRMHIAHFFNLKITNVNNNNYCFVQSYSRGNYAITASTDPLLIKTEDHASISIPLTAGSTESLTPSQMVTRINNTLGDGSTYDLKAVAINNTFILQRNTAGSPGYITVLPSDSNSLFSWDTRGFTTNYENLKNIYLIETSFENTVPEQMPAVNLSVRDYTIRDDLEIGDMTINARVWDTCSAMTYRQLYRNLLQYGEAMKAAIHSDNTPGTNIIDMRVSTIQPNNQLLSSETAGKLGGYIDITIDMIIQEHVNC